MAGDSIDQEGGRRPRVTAAAEARKRRNEGPAIYFIKKAEGSALIQSRAGEKEDAFLQFSDVLRGTKAVITPPIDFSTLARMARENTILEPLIDAMETNVDGTGAELIPVDPEELDTDVAAAEEGSEEFEKATKERERQVEREKAGLQSYFDECWPGTSFLTVRRKLRRDQETLGNAYLEIIRNVKGDIVFLRGLDPKNIRLVKLDDAVTVEKSVVRGGQEAKTKVQLRERRYVQRLGTKIVWFKEFGASRALDATNGDWEVDDAKNRVPPDRRATELIHLTIKPDIDTPYGVPRWLNNAPAIVGSRKAEEFNLEFFEAGGVPPLLIIVSGGKMAANAEQSLREHFTALGQKRHQAAILEAFSTEGDIESAQNVRVTVERFGSDRQKDMLFQKYLDGCDTRVQRGFRLPSIFLGMADSINFATAIASMMVAEAQVFAVERKEFDEIINLKLMPQLPDGDKFEYRSLPLSMRDGTLQVKALELAHKAGAIDGEMLLEAINEVTNLALRAPKKETGPEEEPEPAQAPASDDEEPEGIEGEVPQAGRPPKPPQMQKSVRKEVMTGLRAMAEDAAAMMGEGVSGDSARKAIELVGKVATLLPAEAAVFKALLGMTVYPEFKYDPVGAGEMASCTMAALLKAATDAEAQAAGS